MTNDEIIAVGQQIYDETEVAANTSERVGGVIKGIGQNLKKKDEDIENAKTKIVDDLNEETAASGKALDAHQGFVLAEQIGEVKGALDEIDGTIDKIERGEIDDINISLGSSINNYIGGAGSWRSGGTHYLVRVFEGDKLIINVSDDYTYYAWLNGTETSGTPSYSDGSTQAKAIGRGTKVLTVPANTKYLYFLRTIGSASHSPSTIIIKSFFKETKEKLEVLDETVNEIELINESCEKDYDLAFNDERGYTIVKFTEGHIKTKNFDSRDISIDLALSFIKNKFYGKKCAIVGDSISTFRGWMPSGYAVYYPQGDVQSVNQTWWKITCDKLGMTPVNCAWSGSRVTGAPKGTTASAGCSDKRMEDVGRSGNPDIIIFFIGCNDWGNEVSIGTWNVNSAIVDDSEYTSSQTILDFRAAYALMLKKAQVSYPNAKIFCCTILDDIQRDSNVNYPSNNGNGVTTYTWNQAIKEIADALGVSVIDMHACGINYANLLDFVVDNGLHPNAAGHIKMANKVISELISK